MATTSLPAWDLVHVIWSLDTHASRRACVRTRLDKDNRAQVRDRDRVTVQSAAKLFGTCMHASCKMRLVDTFKHKSWMLQNCLHLGQSGSLRCTCRCMHAWDVVYVWACLHLGQSGSLRCTCRCMHAWEPGARVVYSCMSMLAFRAVRLSALWWLVCMCRCMQAWEPLRLSCIDVWACRKQSIHRTHIRVYVCMHAWKQTYVDVVCSFVRVWIQTYVYVMCSCIHVWIQTYVHVMWWCVHEQKRICAHRVCMHACTETK